MRAMALMTPPTIALTLLEPGAGTVVLDPSALAGFVGSEATDEGGAWESDREAELEAELEADEAEETKEEELVGVTDKVFELLIVGVVDVVLAGVDF
jgi:hypothetical protein